MGPATSQRRPFTASPRRPVASSLRFDRNLNTGGKNYDESRAVIADDAVHHSMQYPSELEITLVKK